LNVPDLRKISDKDTSVSQHFPHKQKDDEEKAASSRQNEPKLPPSDETAEKGGPETTSSPDPDGAKSIENRRLEKMSPDPEGSKFDKKKLAVDVCDVQRQLDSPTPSVISPVVSLTGAKVAGASSVASESGLSCPSSPVVSMAGAPVVSTSPSADIAPVSSPVSHTDKTPRNKNKKKEEPLARVNSARSSDDTSQDGAKLKREKKGRRKDKSTDDTGLAWKEKAKHDGDRSPLGSFMPGRKGDPQEIRGMAMGSEDSAEEKKEEESMSEGSETQKCPSVLLGELYEMLSENEKPTKEQLNKFEELMELTFPSFDCKQASAIECARIQVQARRKNVPVAITKALLDALQALPEQEINLNLKSGPPIEVVRLMSQQDRLGFLIGRMLAVKDAERRRNVMIYSVGATFSEEAFEVDLNGDFRVTTRSYAGSESSEDDDQWWEAADKLSKQVVKAQASECYSVRDDMSASISSNASEDSDTSDNTKSTADRQIIEYWANRKSTAKPRKSYQKAGVRAPIPANESFGSHSYSSMSHPSIESDEVSWIRKRSMAIWPKTSNNQGWLPSRKHDSSIVFVVNKPRPIDAVRTTRDFVCPGFIKKRNRGLPGTNQWREPYKTRTKHHPGYFTVDVNSLYETSKVQTQPHPLDSKPWEHRLVKQRFLHEQSISYSRNWFGAARKVYGNDKLVMPVCRPKSMEMPMKAGEWTEEWYQKPWTSYSDSSMDSSSCSEELESQTSRSEMDQLRRRYRTGEHSEDDDDDENGSWEDIPECGTIRNVKLKIGERISRVTPDITSSLRRSRWRRKFFPRGTFPY